MPELRVHPSWRDKRWRTGFQKLPAHKQRIIENSLRDLLLALAKCRHPRFDGEFQRWSPSRWDVPRQQATAGDWVEYRLGDDENRGRVNICFDGKEQVIYLVARTAIHDHTALRELVAAFRVPRKPEGPAR